MSTVESTGTDSPSETTNLKMFPPNGASMMVPAPVGAAGEGVVAFGAEPSLIVTELSAFKVTEYS